LEIDGSGKGGLAWARKFMCAIVGFLYSSAPKYTLPVKHVVTSMLSVMGHRGPDSSDYWCDEQNVVLGHARLAILDLSSAGNQPMQSPSGRFVMAFNGEIYNHHALRNELNAIGSIKWRSNSDTETLLAAIEVWGLEVTAKKIRGMFAIALWDKQSKSLSLLRDHMGEKPIYYGWVNGQFVFASELKAIKIFPNFNNEIDRNALGSFLRFNSIPAPYSIYKKIFKLEPGCIISLCKGSKEVKQTCFWSTEDIFKNGIASPFSGKACDAIDALEDVLANAVSLQMQADVRLGAFLSGGIDSSTIVALMQAQSSQKINTFSMGFDVKEYNEAVHARSVAKHIGTNHFDMYITERDALDVIPLLPNIYDEPFADSSQIPTYLLAKIAKQKVTVALTGDAGDELFGGYNRYVFANQYFHRMKNIPIWVRKIIISFILNITEEKWSMIFSQMLNKGPNNFGSMLHKGAAALDSRTIRDLHFKLVSQVQSPKDWLINSNEYKTIFNDGLFHFDGLGSIDKMMAYDLVTYLPTDILTKVDRAAMSVSLETRVPFLDPDVVKFSASLPLEYKIREGVNKWVLREVLYKYVPKSLIDRPKKGFAVPLAEWLRGPLRDWSEGLLDERRLKEDGYFNVSFVRDRWHEHLSGKCNWHHQLWNVLMFQAWHECNKKTFNFIEEL
jgi:asparagine synthase (glutamine-hydrolysing)